jgi:hypothetical protein
MAPNLDDFYKQGILQVKDGTAQETAQMVERLRAFLDVHGSFTEQHRLSVYRQVFLLMLLVNPNLEDPCESSR